MLLFKNEGILRRQPKRMGIAGCLLIVGIYFSVYAGGGLADCARPAGDPGGNVAKPRVARKTVGKQNSGSRMGPLTVSAVNSRYFSEPSGRAIYLTGAHTWNNLVDMSSQYPPRQFNFDAYLDFLKAHNHNLVRLWTWEVPHPNDEKWAPQRKFAAPQPWLRTGPGTDVTGLPKFDLSKFDSSYFRRLRTRVEAARDRGMYVIIMLFEGWSVQFSPGGHSHPFYAPNNINAMPDLTDLRDIHTLRHPRVTQLQENYVQEVINTVNDVDNVLFEIVNEAGPYSTAWQYAMVNFVKRYECTKGNQHPVGMTYQYKGGLNSTLFNSAADWIAPGPESGNYTTHPEAATGLKVVISDTDHLGGSSFGDPLWVYKSFFRGLNTMYMDRYVAPDSLNSEQMRYASAIRAAMGQVRLIAELIDIGGMVPAPGLATTGYALRGADGILALAPNATRFDVDLKAMAGKYRLEWFDTATGRVSGGPTINGGAIVSLQSPSQYGAVVYLRNASLSGPSLTEIQNRAQSIRQASMQYAPWLTRMRLNLKPYLNALTDRLAP